MAAPYLAGCPLTEVALPSGRVAFGEPENLPSQVVDDAVLGLASVMVGMPADMAFLPRVGGLWLDVACGQIPQSAEDEAYALLGRIDEGVASGDGDGAAACACRVCLGWSGQAAAMPPADAATRGHVSAMARSCSDFLSARERLAGRHGRPSDHDFQNVAPAVSMAGAYCRVFSAGDGMWAIGSCDERLGIDPLALAALAWLEKERQNAGHTGICRVGHLLPRDGVAFAVDVRDIPDGDMLRMQAELVDDWFWNRPAVTHAEIDKAAGEPEEMPF